MGGGVGGGGGVGNMLRRGGSSWLCMKFEVAFIAGHGIFDEGYSVILFLRVACE